MENSLENDKALPSEESSFVLKNLSSFKDSFIEHLDCAEPQIRTGYRQLDIYLNGGLHNDLYIFAAETSTGKSAFCMSIAQNIAKSGIDVIYFSLEMTRDEHIARGISSLSFANNPNQRDEKNRINSSELLFGSYDKDSDTFSKRPSSTYKDYIDQYFMECGDHLHIVEGGETGLTVQEITDLSKKFNDENDGKPVVVFIDYLQIIRTDETDRKQSEIKSKTDTIVLGLKQLASQVGMPVITISSVSRARYNDSVGIDSAKNSGGVEYTCGVLIGWNWEGITGEKVKDKQRTVKAECNKKGFRTMNLEILKSRNTMRDCSVRFRYYPAYSFFEEIHGENDDNTSSQNQSYTVSDDDIPSL